jgi:hypothetical protein
MTTLLQIFLLLNVFVLGGLAVIAWRHAYAHFRPHKHEPERPRPPTVQDVHLSPEMRERLLKTAEANFKAALDTSATKLHHELDDSSAQLNKLVEHMGAEIVSNELERYRQELADLRKQADDGMAGISAEVAKHEEEIRAKMAQEVETEKLHLIKQIDTKLADAVASFLIEALQHNVDLGAQTVYLTSLLEEHKADFSKEIAE